MKMASVTVMAVLAAIWAGSAGAEELVIEGVGINRDIPCNTKDVSISGAENTIHLTGECGQINVYGSKHTISFEKGRTLAVAGDTHTVTGGAIGSLSVETTKNTVSATIHREGGIPAVVAVVGAQHNVELALESKTALNVSGGQHNVELSLAKGVAEPEINVTGALNSVQKKR